jgi:hypothetical protein
VATWNSNGADTGGSGGYVSGTQGVQYIVNTFASDGDVITLPTGTFSWSTGVSFTKSISIIGSSYSLGGIGDQGNVGSLPTIINWNSTSGVPFLVNPGSSGNYLRISGIAFGLSVTYGTTFNPCSIKMTGSSANDLFRIDNCSFSAGTQDVVFMEFDGNGYGLVDHCTFTNGGASETIHNQGTGYQSTAGWVDDIIPGTNQMLYVENCRCVCSQTSPFNKITEGYYGCRSVFRYNYLNFSSIDQHGNVNVSARWIEIYSNTFYVPPSQNQANFMILRGGSGFIYNNVTAGGPNLGAGTINFYSDYTNTPPSYGPGAGIVVGSITASNTNSPYYLWNNGVGASTIAMPSGSGSSNVVAGTNFIDLGAQGSIPTNLNIYQKAAGAQNNFAYVPYTYPHPLINRTQGGGGTLPIVVVGSMAFSGLASPGIVNPSSGGMGGPSKLIVARISH